MAKSKIKPTIYRIFDGKKFRLHSTGTSKTKLRQLGAYGAAKKRTMEYYRVVPLAKGYALYIR
jgi:hypothetical protein